MALPALMQEALHGRCEAIMWVDEPLRQAFEATFCAQFRWLKAAESIAYRTGVVGPHRHVVLGAKRRRQVYARDRGECYLCGLPIDADCQVGPRACTIDHIRPLSQGGAKHALGNLALAHWQCNQLKGTAPYPTTLYERDGWRCRRCRDPVSRDAQQPDWHWNRPIIEHVVPLDSPDIWWLARAWCCHLRCHQYWLPIPPIDAQWDK